MRVPLKTLFMLLLIGLSFPLLAQSPKGVAYVNYQQIQKQLPAYAAGRGEVEAFEKGAMAELSRQRKDLEQKYRTPALRGDTATHFAMLRRETQAYNQQEALREKEIMQKREQTLAAVDATIKRAVEEVARREGYSGVIDTGSAVYHDKSQDITALVLARLGVK